MEYSRNRIDSKKTRVLKALEIVDLKEYASGKSQISHSLVVKN